MVERKLVKNYFERYFSIKALIVAIIGLLFIPSIPTFGFILLLAGGAWLAFTFFLKTPATDQQVDQLISQELNELKKKGLHKIGLIEEEVNLIEPIVVHGPYPHYLNQDTKFYYKKGKDSEIRASVIKGVVFFFSENQVYSYTCVVDLLTGNHFVETTDEYFYRDVVSVATKSERIRLEPNNKALLGGRSLFGGAKKTDNSLERDVESFTLTTSGGTSIHAYIRDNTVMNEQKGNMDVSDTEEKIKAMRNLLREKKAV